MCRCTEIRTSIYLPKAIKRIVTNMLVVVLKVYYTVLIYKYYGLEEWELKIGIFVCVSMWNFLLTLQLL